MKKTMKKIAVQQSTLYFLLAKNQYFLDKNDNNVEEYLWNTIKLRVCYYF